MAERDKSKLLSAEIHSTQEVLSSVQNKLISVCRVH
jgi:hypothetical protein